MKKRYYFIPILCLLFTMGLPEGLGVAPDNLNSGIDLPKLQLFAPDAPILMQPVPAKSFKTGRLDDGTAVVSAPYWIGQTEVTYALWYKVYTWAIDPARGNQRYNFANPGREGNDGVIGAAPTTAKFEPVTGVCWRDIMVWCNALTEAYNARYQANLQCVYQDRNGVVRDSRDSNRTACDYLTPIGSAKGFRLPTSNEWDLAARFIKDINNDGDIMDNGEAYPGNHVSGDSSSYCYPEDAGTSKIFGNYAWYKKNCNSTNPVGLKTPNALRLFDICGNVDEFCFDGNGTLRTYRGGYWGATLPFLHLSRTYDSRPDYTSNSIGFRLARNQ